MGIHVNSIHLSRAKDQLNGYRPSANIRVMGDGILAAGAHA